jgi:hypothetical protein
VTEPQSLSPIRGVRLTCHLRRIAGRSKPACS